MVDIDKPLIDQFFDVAQQHPDRPAIEDGGVVWTYAELGDRVAWLAGEIPAGRPEEPVAIDLPYAAAFPWAMLACLAVGRPYVPLDRSAPAERNRAIMAAAGATFVVHDGAGALAGALPGVDVRAWAPGARRRVRGVAGLAYILFTSGSTGKPKGVYQTQRGLLHDVRQYLETVRVRPHDRLSLLYSPGVNGAIRDIYGALLSGACLCLRDLRRHGLAGLDAWLEATGVTIYHSIPNIFRTMLAMRGGGTLSGVRWVYLAGDRIFTSDFEMFKRFMPAGARLHVGIGATEAATIYRQWVLDESEVIEEAFLPLGFAVEERAMRLVSEDGEDVAPGEMGEIVVRSAFVAQGYWRDPVRTAERFTDHGDGTRTYATGDLGRLRPDGHLELVGRADRQVKIGGTRVEPGEVESALLAIDGVVRAAVLPDERGDGSLRLVAFVMVEEAGILTPERLRDRVREQLPPAFVPAEVRVLAELPLMHNFKTDLTALRAMLQRSEAEDDDPVSLAWRGLLGRTGPLEADESWQDAGGDSLALAHLQIQLRRSWRSPCRRG